MVRKLDVKVKHVFIWVRFLFKVISIVFFPELWENYCQFFFNSVAVAIPARWLVSDEFIKFILFWIFVSLKVLRLFEKKNSQPFGQIKNQLWVKALEKITPQMKIKQKLMLFYTRLVNHKTSIKLLIVKILIYWWEKIMWKTRERLTDVFHLFQSNIYA